MRFSGGHAWWAQFEFTRRINITPTILPKKIEDSPIPTHTLLRREFENHDQSGF
jgi:hypothetical protein